MSAPVFLGLRPFWFFRALVALLFLGIGVAQAQTPQPPDLGARAWLLLDHQSGQSLVSKEPETRVEPASLTKLMTAYLVFSALEKGQITQDQVAPVSERAWKMEGSRMFIEPRKSVTVQELIRGMIVQSGNDACVALAELIAGDETLFAQRMNEEAQRLGMKNTHFMNTTGLPDENHYTTVGDLGILARAIIEDFPQHYAYYSEKEYRYNNITQPNRNRLLWLDTTVDGMKTGHTRAAGYCLVSSALRGDRRLIAVVVGADSDNARVQDSLTLLNFGFQFFDSVKLYQARQAVSTVTVWRGLSSSLPIGFENDFAISLPKGQADRLQVHLETTQPLMAPIEKGQNVGTLTLTIDDHILGKYPVTALESVSEAGFFKRSWDAVQLWFQSL
jgi:serine-type D-Ala-D-Ala carboxypeptidase (penicillin-binding protein 5/6)